MKIGIVPFYDGLLNNKLFDITDCNLNADNLITPYFEIKEKLKDTYDINTIDKYSDLQDVDCVLFFYLDYKLLLRCIKNGVKKLVYFAWEPEVVDERHSKKNLRKIESFFDAIMTWNDDIVDNIKYFKINYPYFFDKLISVCTIEEFNKKKLLVNISGNKFSSHKSELYSERLKVIRFYEQGCGDTFELYGRGWSKGMRTFKGECLRKSDVYRNFKFALCLENMCNVNGYITEKIFDCFISGVVPVYWGANNVLNYIPKECYIDYPKFNNICELDNFLSSMTYQDYVKYIDNINRYLQSSKKDLFTSSFFCESMAIVLQKEFCKRGKANIWKLNYYRIYYVIKGILKKVDVV